MMTPIQILVAFTARDLEVKTSLTGMSSMVDDNSWFLGFRFMFIMSLLTASQTYTLFRS